MDTIQVNTHSEGVNISTLRGLTSPSLYQKAFDYQPNALLILDMEGKILEANSKAVEIFSCELSELIESNITQWDISKGVTGFLKLLRDKEIKSERVIQTKDGIFLDVEVTASRKEFDGINVIFFYLSDNTVEKKKFERIAAQQKEFESIFNISKDGIAIINTSGNFVDANEAYVKMLGYTSDELMSKNHQGIVESSNMVLANKMIASSFDGSSFENIEISYTHKDGHVIVGNVSSVLMPNKKNLLLTVKNVTDDVQLRTDLKRDKLVIQQSKLAAMGEMISNIAHQWRQPLSAITMTASNIQMSMELEMLNDGELTKWLETITSQANYLSETINTFRDFIKEDKELVSMVLQERIDVALDITKATLRSNYIRVKKEYDTDTPICIDTVKGELEQVFVNIINNARDAIGINEIEDPWIKLKVAELQESVKIEIEDNAGGIPDDVIGRIFEPYFTTKFKSKGTGIGLYMSKMIVERSINGTITAKNTKEGAKFTIHLPKGECPKAKD